jgi:RNA polymerase sigma factor (sigma-70 family)
MVGIFVNRTIGAGLSELIADAQRNSGDDAPAMNEIVRRFEGLTMRLSRSMTRSFDLQDDLANAARVALVRAVRRHDQSRAGFPAYAEKYMRGAVLREYQKWVLPEIPNADLVEATAQIPDVEAPQEQVLDQLAPWGSGQIAAAIDQLDPSQHQIVSLRYAEDASIASIAKLAGTTPSAVSQRLATIHRAVTLALAA